MGAAVSAIPIVGSLVGGLTGGAQQSQQNTGASQAAGALSGIDTTLMNNFTTSILPQIQSLITGGLSGSGPLGTLFNPTGSGSPLAPLISGITGAAGQLQGIGQGLENANVFPSAGTSAMNTLISRIGSIANPGAVVENTSSQIGQEGLAGQIAAKQAGAGIIGNAGTMLGNLTQTLGGLTQSGLGDISSLLNLATGPLSSGISSLGGLAQMFSNNASSMGSPWGSAISGIGTGLQAMQNGKAPPSVSPN